jgi:hypothetical protein
MVPVTRLIHSSPGNPVVFCHLLFGAEGGCHFKPKISPIFFCPQLF